MTKRKQTKDYNLVELVLGTNPQVSLPTPRESYISRLIEVMNPDIGTYEDKQDVANRVYNTLIDMLDIMLENPDPYKPLKDSFGVNFLDELDAIELVMGLEVEFGVTIPEDLYICDGCVRSPMYIASALYDEINKPEEVKKESPRQYGYFSDD